MLKVALQLYTIRDYVSALGFDVVLPKVKALGFEGVEFAGFGDVPPEKVKALLEENELAVTSCHVALPPLQENVDDIIAYQKAIGNDKIVCAWAPMNNADEFNATVAGLKAVSEKCVANGISLFYHNHWQELEFMIDGTRGFDRLFQIFTPEQLRPEADCCWLNRGGVSPVEYTKKYGNITSLWHIKDSAGRSDMQLGDVKGGLVDVQKSEAFRFTIAGEGEVGIADVVKAANETNIEWLIYENDQPQPEGFYVAGRSCDFLKAEIAKLG